MSSLKLKHSGGNSMSIEAPATNPASNLALKLPATIGSANQVLKNSGTAGTLGWSSFVEDSSGNCGIGDNSPQARLHIQGENSTNGTLYLEPDSNKGSNISHIHHGSAGNWYIRPADASGYIYHDIGKSQFTNGILFGSDTAAANTLDDYEEGSWTPALYNGTGITVHSASYTKVGNLCNVSAYVTLSTNSSSGMVKFNSLPFTAANVGYSIGSAYTQNTGATHVFSQIDSNSTNIIIYKTNGGTVYQSELSGAYVLFSGTYRTT